MREVLKMSVRTKMPFVNLRSPYTSDDRLFLPSRVPTRCWPCRLPRTQSPYGNYLSGRRRGVPLDKLLESWLRLQLLAWVAINTGSAKTSYGEALPTIESRADLQRSLITAVFMNGSWQVSHLENFEPLGHCQQPWVLWEHDLCVSGWLGRRHCTLYPTIRRPP